MKLFSVLSVLILSSLNPAFTQAQVRATQIVSVEKGTPILGASLVVGKTELRADASGHITLPSNISGKVFIKAPGFERREFSVNSIPLKTSLRSKVVRALYLSAPAYEGMGRDSTIDRVLGVLQTTGYNGLVIDFKDDDGNILSAAKVEANTSKYPKDPKQFVEFLKSKGIYTIARITTFKDSRAAKANPENAVHDEFGNVWENAKGEKWLDASVTTNWQYVVEKCKLAVDAGFDEIQFDYVRLPSDGRKLNGKRVKRILHHPMDTLDQRVGVIAGFMAYARKELAPLGVFISADLFGYVYYRDLQPGDNNIGQRVENLAPFLDYISPMAYPSHYSDMGVPPYAPYDPSWHPKNAKDQARNTDPTTIPYEVVFHTVNDIRERIEALTRSGQLVNTEVRAWIQDFSNFKGQNTFIPEHYSSQVKGASDGGGAGFMVWDAGNRYHFTQAALQQRLKIK